MHYLHSRGVRALGVGILFAVVVGLVSTGGGPLGGARDERVEILVSTTPLLALHTIRETDLATVETSRSAIAALGEDLAMADQRALVVGTMTRTGIAARRAILLSDLYRHGGTASPLVSRAQALYTLPLPSSSYPLPGLQPDDYVDVHAIVTRVRGRVSIGENGASVISNALTDSPLGAELLVSKARVYAVGSGDITLIVPRDTVPTLNLMRALGTYSFAQVAPDAPLLAPSGITPRQFLEDTHVSTR